MPDPIAVRSMFSRISGRYDLANHLLSGGIDYWWRRRLVRAIHDTGPADILDLATGSGDVAFALADALQEEVNITGMDFCQPMLDEAIRKRSARPRRARIEFRQGDALDLPLEDCSFDAVSMAFGLRNMADRRRCLSEIRRVLRPGGRVFVLEFSQPIPVVRPFYGAYLRHVLPLIAHVVTGDRSAYDYLCGSIEQFPGRVALEKEFTDAGFRTAASAGLTLGIVALHIAAA